MDTNLWALILGGSSGLGLATAKKLASHGYHIIVVHRDRRSDMVDIETSFEEIRSYENQLITLNADALNAEKRSGIISDIELQLPEGHQIKVLVHSVAKGTLKPMYSESNSTLTDTDFRITFDAMALSLYDWTKALVATNLFASDTRIISFTSEGNTKALPNNRLTTPDDVANAVYLLTTDEAKWITGTVIKVDGGESLI